MIGQALSILTPLLDRVIPDKNARAEAEELLQQMDKRGELDLLVGQLEINKAEAAHKSLFVAGWRPAVGWICAVSLGYNYVLYPVMQFGVALAMPEPPVLPAVDLAGMMPVLLGMLGLAGYRTIEKRSKVAREE